MRNDPRDPEFARYSEIWHDAYIAGYDAGRDAAEAGAPVPDLSGEWAGSETPASLMASLDIPEGWDDGHDDFCTAWEEGSQEGWEEVQEERLAQANPDPDLAGAMAFLGFALQGTGGTCTAWVRPHPRYGNAEQYITIPEDALAPLALFSPCEVSTLGENLDPAPHRSFLFPSVRDALGELMPDRDPASAEARKGWTA